MEKYLTREGFLKTIALSARPILVLVILVFGSVELSAQSQEKTSSLFDGKTLSGWKAFPADQNVWKAADSIIVGGDGFGNIPLNLYLHTEKEYGDFELRCLFRLSGDPGTGMINSGVQYRSSIINGEMVGYQADIGNGFWGDLYDEHRRGTLVKGDLSILRHLLHEDGWNSYIVRVKDNRHELYINGVKTCDYVEKDPTIPKKGIIAFQLHSGGAAKVELRGLRVTEL